MNNHGEDGISNESSSLLHDNSNGHHLSLETPTSTKHTEEVEITSIKSYIRLLLFFVASVIAGGIIPGQNEYNRLFCEAGLFRYACNNDSDSTINDYEGDDLDTSKCCNAQWLIIANLMNVLTLAVTILFVVSGVLFDMIGGRYSSALGCAVMCVGFSILAVLIHLLTSSNFMTPVVETLIFALGVILCDLGSFLVNVGFYGFLWHIPKRQAFVLSLSNSCMSCASFLPLVMSSFMNWSKFSLSASLLGYAVVIILLSGTLCWINVPSVEEYRTQALRVLGLPIPRRTVKGMDGMRKQLLEAIQVLVEPTHAKFHKISIVAMVLAFAPSFIWMSMGQPLGDEIFQNQPQSDDQPSLGVLFLKVNTLVGLFVGPSCALFIDLAQHPSDGLIEVGILISISFAIVAPFCSIASWPVQMIVLIFICTSQTLCLLYVMRYSVVFAYPNRVGTVGGLLVALLGTLSLPVVLVLSVGIAFFGYVLPSSIIAAISGYIWIVYVMYLKRTKPFPSQPILLPADERDIAKNFSVATIEDAAFVANMKEDELLALSASTKVESMRRLSGVALANETSERVLKLARRRSSLLSIESTYSAIDYPIPTFAQDKVVKGTMNTSDECVMQAFNGHGGYGGKNEFAVEWMMSCIGAPDEPKRIEATTAIFRPILAVSETYGIILNVMDTDPMTGNPVTAACCACYPPGDLEDDGSTMKTGSDRYFYGHATADITLSLEDKPAEFVQKMIAFKQDLEWDKKRKDFGDMWYIAVLGTHGAFQKRGYGRLLLDVVSSFANETQHDCYLECSEPNVPFYQRNGFEVVWKNEVSIEGSSALTTYGMAKRYRK